MKRVIWNKTLRISVLTDVGVKFCLLEVFVKRTVCGDMFSEECQTLIKSFEK